MKVVSFLCLLFLPAILYSQQMPPFHFPKHLGKFKLEKVPSNQVSHADSTGTVEYRNLRAIYAHKKDSLWIYLSRFKRPEAAKRMAERMATNLKLGKGGFVEFARDTVLGMPIYSAASPGKAHFFFQNQTDIFWLAGNPDHCYKFLEEFLTQAKLARNESARK